MKINNHAHLSQYIRYKATAITFVSLLSKFLNSSLANNNPFYFSKAIRLQSVRKYIWVVGKDEVRTLSNSSWTSASIHFLFRINIHVLSRRDINRSNGSAPLTFGRALEHGIFAASGYPRSKAARVSKDTPFKHPMSTIARS